MNKLAIISLASALGLSACATSGEYVAPPLGSDTDAVMCDAAPAQSHIGHKATAASGAELMRITRSQTLRWVPPRTAVTMDFRADRLTVSYDDNMIIERISCG